jgi:hypothetical protein
VNYLPEAGFELWCPVSGIFGVSWLQRLYPTTAEAFSRETVFKPGGIWTSPSLHHQGPAQLAEAAGNESRLSSIGGRRLAQA